MARKLEKVDGETIRKMVQDDAMKLPDMNIVISGLAGRFPKADSVSEFEQHLLNKVDMVNDRDEARFQCGLWNLPPRAGRLKDLSKFDCEFFGFTPEEANYIDYQLRILYEVVYESIIDAGVNPAHLRGTNTGVFFGLHTNEFENSVADDPNFKTGGYYAQFAVKVAQYFDLRGLTVTFDAACASAAVGLHNAVQAIKDGFIDQAVVCSSNIPIHPTGSFIFLQMQMLSPTGYSRFLDSRADGYVKSEACVSMLIQRKDVALRNYASFMATMTSVDGFKPEGITFPSANSQGDLIRKTKLMAGISTNHVEYLEAHGTGTPAGDPQEARAIANVYLSNDKRNGDSDERKIGPLLVGSVKTNMGHSEAASGLCALAKVILMLENEKIYASLHCDQPNTNIESLKEGKLEFVADTRELRSKIVPISCYGFGGTNVHAIVRANHQPTIKPEEIVPSWDDKPRLIVMFGRSEQTLNLFFDQMVDTTARVSRNCLSEDFLVLLDTLNSGAIDRLMKYRGFLIVDRRRKGNKELARQIKKCQLPSIAQGKQQAKLLDSGMPEHMQECEQRVCNIILPGLGCQWPAMAAGMRDYKPFWSIIERLSVILEPFEDEFSLIEILTNPNSYQTVSQSMTQTFVSIVAYEIALINIIRDQLQTNNLKNIVGHSLGEISCAYAANILDERETIILAYQMGKVLDKHRHLIAGKMVALGLNESEAEKRIGKYETIQVCCLNGPQSVTVSGSTKEIDELCAELDKNSNILKKQIDCPIALHNDKIMTNEIRQQLKEGMLKVLFPLADYKRGSTGWISTVTEASDISRANAQYYADCLCTKVDFYGAIQQLDNNSIILEVGPSGPFESQLRQLKQSSSSKLNKFHYVKFMKQMTPADEQVVELIKSIGQIYLAGATFKSLSKFHQQFGEQIELPVRRQTPSLSSLFSWSHEHSIFVPRYPQQFGKSSAKTELPIDIIQERDKYISGHCIEGRILYPATGYLFLAWRIFSFVKRKIYDACFHEVERELVPAEFHNVRLFRAVMLGNRTTQIYVHFEEATGRFEVKEGGSVCAEGYVMSPQEKPNGLLYDEVRDNIKKEKLKLTLNSDDIYKQFRISGYDYGETFRNIEASSADGRYSKIKYNGHFIAFTDSVLQTIFLAVSQYSPSGGLFLPTSFEYARFQPEIILKKLRESNMVFDKADRSLDTAAKRAVMTQIMERVTGKIEAKEEEDEEDEEELVDELENGGKNAKDDENKKRGAKKVEESECIFEVFCDPITGIIATDGVEMRGIKATPAPRRADNNEVLLESYQFVREFEDPVEDECLTNFKQVNEKYSQVCDAMSMNLLARLSGKSTSKLREMFDLKGFLEDSEIDAYLNTYLSELYKEAKNIADIQSEKEDEEKSELYDIRKNGDRMLMSVLNQLSSVDNPKVVKEVIHKNRVHLMKDLIQSSFISERFMRSLVETVIENTCLKKMKLKLMEVNVDDGLIVEPLQQMIKSVEPSISIEYSLAHPDLNKLTENKLLASNNQLKTYTMRDLQSLFNDNSIRELDLLVYKDISCYSLPKQVIEQNGLGHVLTSLDKAVRCGGYIMVLLRHKLTLAERILLSVSEPELVGLTKKDLELISSENSGQPASVHKVNHINAILESRCKLMVSEAAKNEMIYLAKKSDSNGCTILLFKRTKRDQASSLESSAAHLANDKAERVLLRVTHENKDKIAEWLEKLKENFKKPVEDDVQTTTSGQDELTEEEAKERESKQKPRELTNQVWLCAVETKQNQISGLIGLMQALRKELGSARLRCYYDCHTFKDRDEPISISDIENCKNFQESYKRNHIWNCFDSLGNSGSFRHFTLDKYMSYEDCSCNSKENTGYGYEITKKCSSNKQVASRQTTNHVPAYVNVAVRGDLSSFTWYEMPSKYLSAAEQADLVKVNYAALNFRDIMNATGKLPLDSIPLRLALSDCLLGLEFSGIDARGKRVMGIVPSKAIATHVLCTKETSIKFEIPDWLNLKEAATIPVVYATVIMSLICRGKMKKGETILIHAGSGAIGQAAIRLCNHYGVKVFTTVGTDEKRKFILKEFGDYLSDDRIFSSRDCTFEEKIMRATNGRGVDLILNSLADDKLMASVRCLADGGRFLEIGKYDLAMDTKLELLKLDINKTFHSILLDKMFEGVDQGLAFENQLRVTFDTIQDGLAKGYIKPIRYTTFKRHEVEEAFRYMATGKHIGKVLIEIEPELERKNGFKHQEIGFFNAPKCIPKFQLSSQKSYIITGGLGGFGLELTKWLVKQGAKHVLLTSRGGVKTGYQKVTLDRLAAVEGVKLMVIDNKIADTTTKVGVEKLIDLAQQVSPLGEIGGIFHLAMVLKDSLIDNMSAEDFELVLKPKVDTFVHLDNITRHMNLNPDFFVAFSSVSCGKGNAGQSNYAYANSCLERICERRREDGIHGLAIQWGAIGDVGIAYESLGGNDIVIGGTIPQRMPSCFNTLSKVLCSPFAVCLSVLPVNKNRAGSDSNEKRDLVSAIMHVLGIRDASKVSEQANLGELGLDSLMAVEIRQYIEREYDMTLNIQEIRSLTIAKIREINDK